MTDTSHPQTLRSLTDLVEVVPTFLGFHPTESVVVISIEAGSVVLTARVDLDLPGGHGTAAALRAVWRKVPHGDHIVIAYSDDPDRAWLALDDVADAMPGHCGRTLLHADGERWYEDPHDSGTPYDRLGSVHLARAAYDGRPVRHSRAELARLVEPARTPAEVTASLERVAESFATLGCLVAEARALVAGHDDAPGDLDIDEATVLCLATHDAAFLDEALLSTTGDNADARIGLWAQVVQSGVPNCAGGALVALALAGWVAGEGAIASICLEALEGRPGPGEWIEMLEAVIADAVHPHMWEEVRARQLALRVPEAS